MTLIAGFRCTDGFLFCADSQETSDLYRVKVQKLIPKVAGNYDLAVAGTGYDGDLIDAFAQRLEDDLASSAISGMDDFRKIAQSSLKDYLSNETAGYSAKQRRMTFMIAGRSRTGIPKFETWYTAASRLIRIDNRKWIGWDEPLYKFEMERMFRSDSDILPISQTIFVALRLFATAKQTSNFVGGPTTIVIGRDSGMYVEEPRWVAHLEERVAVFDAQLRELLLCCPDVSISQDDFASKSSATHEGIMHLRSEYLSDTADMMLRNIGKPDFKGDPYPRIPPGSKISIRATGPTQVEPVTPEERETLRRIREQAKAFHESSAFRKPEE